jgi:hypothetical protein
MAAGEVQRPAEPAAVENHLRLAHQRRPQVGVADGVDHPGAGGGGREAGRLVRRQADRLLAQERLAGGDHGGGDLEVVLARHRHDHRVRGVHRGAPVGRVGAEADLPGDRLGAGRVGVGDAFGDHRRAVGEDPAHGLHRQRVRPADEPRPDEADPETLRHHRLPLRPSLSGRWRLRE